MSYMKSINDLLMKKARLMNYMQMKMEDNDFHGVADAAMDLRELVAKMEVYQELQDELDGK